MPAPAAPPQTTPVSSSRYGYISYTNGNAFSQALHSAFPYPHPSTRWPWHPPPDPGPQEQGTIVA